MDILDLPPPVGGGSETRGGSGFPLKIFKNSRRRRENFEDFVSKSVGQRYENALKVVFAKRKTPKFSRLRRGYTPSNPKIFRACGAATTQAIIHNVSHVVQKVIIQNH